MAGEQRERRPSEVLKRGYSDEEISHLYALGRLWLEAGELRRAEIIFNGISEVAPDYAPGWVACSYVQIQNKNFDAAIYCARQALRLNPDFVEALLYLVTCLLSTGDYNSAGTYLGEIREKIERGSVRDAHALRMYKAQLTRFQNR